MCLMGDRKFNSHIQQKKKGGAGTFCEEYAI